MKRPNPIRLASPAGLISTWFGAGLLPIAPGTWGSLAALPFAWLIHWAGGPIWLGIASLVAYAAGIVASNAVVGKRTHEDPGAIVIDEVAGQWLTLVGAPLSIPGFLLAFLIFRLLDIVKPWPANLAERRLPGGLGIMTDDMVAGVYGAVIMALASRWIELG